MDAPRISTEVYPHKTSKCDWDKLAHAVEDWGAEVVVLVSRKMPHLQEYFSLSFGIDCVVLSDAAIPFAEPSLVGARVAVIDDIINIGTTLREVERRLKEVGVSEVGLFALAARQKSSQSHPEVITACPDAFSEDRYARHVAEIPKIIGALCKPYDLAFPVIPCQLVVPHRNFNDLFLALCKMFGYERVREIRAYSTMSHNRITVDLQQGRVGNFKIRIYCDDQCEKLNVVPFFIPSHIEFKEPELEYDLSQKLHGLLIDKLNRDVASQDKAQSVPPEIFAGLYVSALDGFLYELQNDLEKILVPLHESLVCKRDFEMQFGKLREDWTSKKVGQVVAVNSISDDYKRSGSCVVSPIGQKLKPLLSKLIGSQFGTPPYLIEDIPPLLIFREIFEGLGQLVGAEDPSRYNLSYPFSPEEVLENPYLRLRIGLTFDDLCDCIKNIYNLSYQRTRCLVSQLVDTGIDTGALVPTTICVQSAYYRVYRKGESPFRLEAADRLQYCWSSSGKKLSRTRAAKIFSILSLSENNQKGFHPGTIERGNIVYLPNSVMDTDNAELTQYLLRSGALKA